MKANSTKRKIFDAVDLLTEDTSSQMPVKTMKGGVTMLDIDSIKPFHNHPFWDRSNWQPLCEHHHNVKTMTEDRFKEYRF